MPKGDCPTCAAIEAVLVATKRVPKPAARKIAYSGPAKSADKAIRTHKQVRRVSKYSKKLKQHLIKEREKQTKKNGDFKKGKNMSTVMKAAHRCVKREMK